MGLLVDLEHSIGLIYDAVSDPDEWNSALDAVRRLFEADATLLVYGNLSTGDLGVVGATGFSQQVLREYERNHLNDDEMIRQSMDGPAGIIASSARSYRGKPFYRTSVYRRLLQPSDLAFIAGAAALNSREVHASMWMARSARSPDFSVRDLHVFSELLPHVARAMTAHHRIRQAELQAEMKKETGLPVVPWPGAEAPQLIVQEASSPETWTDAVPRFELMEPSQAA